MKIKRLHFEFAGTKHEVYVGQETSPTRIMSDQLKAQGRFKVISIEPSEPGLPVYQVLLNSTMSNERASLDIPLNMAIAVWRD